jgi:hypothetical protein
MKRLIAILLLCAFPAYCAFNGTVQWDVRTTGSNSNGGAFDPGVTSPGTDYSQQNSAQIAYTDLVIGATTTQYTSALNAVTSAVVGNFIQIVSGTGCTAGFYEILSETAGSPNFATVDRSMGSAASVCTANLGGSLLTIAAALAVMTGGQTLNIKAGTYTITSTLVTPNVSYISVIGYQITHADGGTKPLITTATNSTDMIDSGGAGSYSYSNIYDNLSLSNTAATAGIGIVKTAANGPIVVRNCKLTGFTYDLNGDNAGSHYIFYPTLTVVNTELGTSQYGAYNDGQIWVIGSYVHGASNTGIYANPDSNDWDTVTIVGSVIDSNNVGVKVNDNVMFVNSVVSHSTGVGVDLLQPYTNFSAVNSIFYGNGTYGVYQSNAGGPYQVGGYTNNAWGANGTANTLNLVIPASASANDVALTASPFVGSSNFALNSTSGGGAALKAKGFPGIMPAGTGYEDIGALQSQASAGGGLLRNPSLSGVPQ